MGWKTGVLIVLKEYRNKNLGGAERKLLDSYLGKWVYSRHRPKLPGSLRGGAPHDSRGGMRGSGPPSAQAVSECVSSLTVGSRERSRVLSAELLPPTL